MKRIIFLLLALASMTLVMAQSATSVRQMMDDGDDFGDYLYRESSVMLYQSVTVKDKNLFDKVQNIVSLDAKRALAREEARVGSRLFYAEYTLPQRKKGTNCYVFYKDMRLQKNNTRQELVVIYIETKKSIEQIKQQYKK